MQLGDAYLKLGWLPEAEHAFRAALARGYAGLAAVRLAQGRVGEALALRLRALLPAFGKGNAAPQPQRSGEQALLLAKDAADVDRLLELAAASSRIGRVDEAAAAAQAALRFDPASARILAAVSATLHPWDDAQAERYAREAIGIDPGLEAGHTNLCAALWGQGRLEEAEKHCREAIRLAPGATVNRLNLALLLRHAGRLEEAAALYCELEAEIPGDARLCTEYANLLVESGGSLEQARTLLRRAQGGKDATRPRLFEAALDLLQENYAEGWERYEARKQGYEQRWHATFAAIPEWRGEPLGDRPLLVYGEQSLGDEIMFASMLPDVLTRAKRVTLVCGERLGALFARSFPALEVVPLPLQDHARWLGSRPSFSCAIAAGSLGRLFRRQVSDFPPRAGYLVADELKVAAWRQRLPSGYRVGISWRGGTQGTGQTRRSIPLGDLEPLLRQPGVHWVSLQHGDAPVPSGITSFADVTRNLDELAALVKSLDLVISVCNTNVHVAGALGAEAWVLAPVVPEWRYGLRGERMAWYPSVTMLRQERHGDWAPVVQEAAARLSRT